MVEHQAGAGCRGRQPLQFVRIFYRRKIATLFADFTLCYGIGKSGAEFCSPTPLYFFFYFCVLLFLYLHRLVGLRLLRLCLKLRQGFALYPRTHKPSSAGLEPALYCSLRSVLTLHACDLLGSAMPFLTPHSSLYLTPHLLRHCFFHFLYKLSEHCKCLIDRLSCCHIYTCTFKQ